MHNRVRVNSDRGPLGRVAEIQLVNPTSGNTIDFDFTDDLEAATNSIDTTTSCIVITAEGQNFCLGGDLTAFSRASDSGDYVAELADRLHRSLVALRARQIPIVVGVQGWAAGAGMSLALFGDVCLAENSSKFRTAYGAVGLTPDGGMSWTLPRAVGRSVALDLFLTQRPLGADEAHRLGAVSRLVADGGARTAARGIAETISAGPRSANSATLRLVNHGATTSFAEQLSLEAEQIGTAAGGAEGKEGVSAFLGRRAPTFLSAENATTKGVRSR